MCDWTTTKSPLGAAIGYALLNWVALTRYAEDGRLKIDNNGAEQALRPIVLGTQRSPSSNENQSFSPPAVDDRSERDENLC